MINDDITYKNRIVEETIDKYLRDFTAVLIRGPKWCGKTTTAEYFAKSEIKLNTKKQKEQFDQMYEADPSNFLQGEKPRLIDEWQIYPMIWDEIKNFADKTHLKNQFILTGSSSPKHGVTNHTGYMRIAKIEMSTMTLFESGDSSGEVSLKWLFDNPDKSINVQSKKTQKDISELIVRGGWPEGVINPPRNLTLYGKQALNDICETDIQEASGKDLSPTTTKAILRSLARTISELSDNKTILRDVNESGHPLSETAFYYDYDALIRLFIIKEIPAWSPNIRSVTSIRSLPKKEFFDPSLACACLGLGLDGLEKDRKTRGFMFECLCGRDLDVYAKAIDGEISYYRDRLGLECDYVIHLEDGRYGLFECKCGDEHLKDGINNLNKLERPDRKMNKPTVKVILTDMEYGFKNKDGIYVITIACLKH